MSSFDTIGLITRDAEPRTAGILGELATHLKARGCRVLTEAGALPTPTGCESVERAVMGRECRLAIVIGGDGTFINATRSLAAEVPLLGINVGRLGFLVDISPDDMLDRIDEILDGKFIESSRALLLADLIRNGRTISESVAVNDVVLHVNGRVRMIEFDTLIDGRPVFNQRADGIIVATPTGSTAYALSAGGPIVEPSLDALVLAPICPHTLSHRPIVVSDRSVIEIVFSEHNRCPAQIALDGQVAMDVEGGDRIRIVVAGHRLRIVHPAGHDHFRLLRNKLRWGEQP